MCEQIKEKSVVMFFEEHQIFKSYILNDNILNNDNDIREMQILEYLNEKININNKNIDDDDIDLIIELNELLTDDVCEYHVILLTRSNKLRNNKLDENFTYFPISSTIFGTYDTVAIDLFMKETMLEFIARDYKTSFDHIKCMIDCSFKETLKDMTKSLYKYHFGEDI